MTTSDAQVAQSLLAEARQQFEGCRWRVRHCLDQLSDEQVWWRAGEEFNSIGNLVLHLNGNVRQRILSLIGGEPDDRNRDAEFAERRQIPAAELAATFDDTMRRVDAVLASLAPEMLLEKRRYERLKGPVEGNLVNILLYTLVHVGGHAQEIIALTRLQLRERYQFLLTPKK